MPFSMKGLKVLMDGAPVADGSTSPVFAHYITADAIADVNTADYFLSAITMLPLHSLIWVTSSTGTTAVHHLVYVNSNTGSAIDVTDGLAVTSTDTD